MSETNSVEFVEAVRERFPDLPFVLFVGRGDEAVFGYGYSRSDGTSSAR